MSQRSRVISAAVRGVEGEPVIVEVQLDTGLPGTAILGLPDSAVRESRDRVKAAIHSSGFDFPHGKVLVNLAPAHTRKEGPWFDLPIALAVLAAAGALPGADLTNSVFVGELALDGSIRPVRGALAVAHAARRLHITRLFAAPSSAQLCALVEGIDVFAVPDLQTVVKILMGTESIEKVASTSALADPATRRQDPPLLEDITGQTVAKRALVIAAAGGHNLLFSGSPGAGKSMMAQRLPFLLPPPSLEECVEITQIHDLIKPRGALVRERPFRAPHHSTSRAGLVGGGPDVRPGEISLAHRGVLFLDELPEFQRDSLEALRQPLEDGKITISRSTGSFTFPASFQLVAAMNPCPCGWKGHAIRPCVCLPRDLSRYQTRASGPLLDRFDISIHVPPIQPSELGTLAQGLTTDEAAALVVSAREIQHARWRALLKVSTSSACENARISARQLDRLCPLDAKSKKLLERAMERLGLTMRAYGKTLRVARTIADLDGQQQIAPEHVAEALGYRIGEGK